MKPSFVWILQCCWVQIFTCDNDLATDFSFSRNDIATSKERQRDTDTDTDTERQRQRWRILFLPSSRYKNLNPKLKPNTSGIECFSNCLLIIADLQSPFPNASVVVVYTLIWRFRKFHFTSWQQHQLFCSCQLYICQQHLLNPFLLALFSTLFCKPTIYYCDPAQSFRLQQKPSDLLWTLSTVLWALVNSPTSSRDHHHHPRHQKISKRLLPWVHPWLISLELQTFCQLHAGSIETPQLAVIYLSSITNKKNYFLKLKQN